MEASRFDASLNVLAGSAGRRDALRSLGAAGMALLAALGLRDAVARKKAKKKGKKQCSKIDRCPRKACCVCGGAENRCILIPHPGSGVSAACEAACAPDPRLSAETCDNQADPESEAVVCTTGDSCACVRCPLV